MFFCPQCKYVFDIKKGEVLIDKEEIKDINNIFKLIKKQNDLSKYSTEIELEDIKKNKKYKVLSSSDKNKILELFSSNNSSGLLECNNCGYQESIGRSLNLYSINFKNSASSEYDIEHLKLLSLDPTLPRTRDYTCKNNNCITHKKNDVKEAIYYRDDNTYNINYCCTTCYTNWKL
jgi:hypothetical protein